MSEKFLFVNTMLAALLTFLGGFYVGKIIYEETDPPCQQQKPESVSFHYGQRVEIIDGFYKGRQGVIKEDYIEGLGYLVQLEIYAIDRVKGLHRELEARIQPHEMLLAPPDPLPIPEASNRRMHRPLGPMRYWGNSCYACHKPGTMKPGEA